MQRHRQWHRTLILAVAVLAGCASTSSPSRLERLAIGSGGGFSGIHSGYRLERSGIVEEFEIQSGTTRVRSTAKFPASVVRRFFVRAEELRLDTLGIDQPGNMTWWLEVAHSSGSKRLRWSDPDRIPPELAAFANELKTFCANAISGK